MSTAVARRRLSPMRPFGEGRNWSSSMASAIRRSASLGPILGEGEPVILLHGIPTWSFLYNEVIPPLAPDRRVIAPDFLGHGYSDRRDFFDRSLLAQTDMIIRLMDHLGLERADFVGHDTGGGVALIMAIHHPDRVARLVLDERCRLRFLAHRRHDRPRQSELAQQIAESRLLTFLRPACRMEFTTRPG